VQGPQEHPLGLEGAPTGGYALHFFSQGENWLSSARGSSVAELQLYIQGFFCWEGFLMGLWG